MPRLFENINFPKAIAVLASVFGVALGLCGFTAITALGLNGAQNPTAEFFGRILTMAAPVELLAMALSAVGLVVMTILWVISSVVGGFGSSSDPQKLFEGKDEDDGKNSRE